MPPVIHLSMADSIQKKKLIGDRVIIILLVIMVVSAIGLGVLANEYAVHNVVLPNGEPTDIPSLDNAFWRVIQSVPGEKKGIVDITLQSSIGNLRVYETLRGYGISNSGQTLAATTAKGVEITKLSSDKTSTFDFPFLFKGEQEKAISWSHLDKYFALGILRVEENKPEVIIFDADGNLKINFSADLAYQINDGLEYVYPVFFSPGKDWLLVRSYIPIDSTGLTPDQMPVNLQVFDLTGNLIWEKEIRDTDQTGAEVAYFWDRDGKTVLYTLVPAGSVINYADKHLFTSIEVIPEL